MKISIIVPTLNEAQQIGNLLERLPKISERENIEEVIIADGMSSDNTVDIVRKKGGRIFASTERGRAVQMNNGATMAKGDILYFLHADTLPPAGFDREILNAVKEGWESGCFRLKFDASHTLLVFFQWFTRFNFLLCRGGDQSLFVTKGIFQKVNGFNEVFPVMEDIEIISRIRKEAKFKVLHKEAVTSARKYHRNGFWRLQFLFALIWISYIFGIKPQTSYERIYKKYIL